MNLFINKTKIKWEYDNFIKKNIKNKTKKSISVNFLNHDSGYNTESTIYKKIMRVKNTKKQHKKIQNKKYNKNNEC